MRPSSWSARLHEPRRRDARRRRDGFCGQPRRHRFAASLKPGQRTTTIESNADFFAGIPIGDVAKAESIPLHRGRSTIVVQTRITRGDGRLAAIVTQTQMVLAAKGQD